jgi:hypothetical protein
LPFVVSFLLPVRGEPVEPERDEPYCTFVLSPSKHERTDSTASLILRQAQDERGYLNIPLKFAQFYCPFMLSLSKHERASIVFAHPLRQAQGERTRSILS